MSFRKILVAIDQSLLSSIVLEQALDYALKDGAKLMAFHCINSGTLSDLPPHLYFEVETEKAQEWLQPYCQKAADQGTPVECVVEVGQPGPSICDLAERWSADLIILGRRNQTGLTRLLLGSVSNHVVHHAPCSVLVLHG